MDYNMTTLESSPSIDKGCEDNDDLDQKSEAERIHNSIMERLRNVNWFVQSITENIEIEKNNRSVRSQIKNL